MRQVRLWKVAHWTWEEGLLTECQNQSSIYWLHLSQTVSLDSPLSLTSLSFGQKKTPFVIKLASFGLKSSLYSLFSKSAGSMVFWAQEAIFKLLCLQEFILQAHRRARAISYFHPYLFHCPLAFEIELQDSGWNPPVHHRTVCAEHDNSLL